ncbi:hypothetical protein P280DRAFT_210279 [Massarina eburnea CBS 473.64]|uniref:Uncharacterized protein n=1 Tax=Massarina eburnea CBS 473.64 TaxID=1395130 RepID=A0A6A6RIC3_9PLEO|nr:hypothetical protein P280DRAFT_210279 [Massarina eburnea CBS 473.64]
MPIWTGDSHSSLATLDPASVIRRKLMLSFVSISVYSASLPGVLARQTRSVIKVSHMLIQLLSSSKPQEADTRVEGRGVVRLPYVCVTV